MITADVREKVYETLRKNGPGYENVNTAGMQYNPSSSAKLEGNQQLLMNVPVSTSGPMPVQCQNSAGHTSRHTSTTTNILGLSGFSSPYNARKKSLQQGAPGNVTNSPNSDDAMALYARVDRTKKKKNRESGGSNR